MWNFLLAVLILFDVIGAAILIMGRSYDRKEAVLKADLITARQDKLIAEYDKQRAVDALMTMQGKMEQFSENVQNIAESHGIDLTED